MVILEKITVSMDGTKNLMKTFAGRRLHLNSPLLGIAGGYKYVASTL